MRPSWGEIPYRRTSSTVRETSWQSEINKSRLRWRNTAITHNRNTYKQSRPQLTTPQTYIWFIGWQCIPRRSNNGAMLVLLQLFSVKTNHTERRHNSQPTISTHIPIVAYILLFDIFPVLIFRNVRVARLIAPRVGNLEPSTLLRGCGANLARMPCSIIFSASQTTLQTTFTRRSEWFFVSMLYHARWLFLLYHKHIAVNWSMRFRRRKSTYRRTHSWTFAHLRSVLSPDR